MKKAPITESAEALNRFHQALDNARRDFKRKKLLFDAAEQRLADAQGNFDAVKGVHGDKLRELR